MRFACHVTSLTSLLFAAITETCGGVHGVRTHLGAWLAAGKASWISWCSALATVPVSGTEPCWSCRRRMRSMLPVSSVRPMYVQCRSPTVGPAGGQCVFLVNPCLRMQLFQLFSPRSSLRMTTCHAVVLASNVHFPCFPHVGRGFRLGHTRPPVSRICTLRHDPRGHGRMLAVCETLKLPR